MFERVWDWLWEPGPIKSSSIAAISLLPWDKVKPILDDLIVFCTAVVVINHVVTITIRRWCPLRRKGECGSCRLKGSIWCPKGLGDSK